MAEGEVGEKRGETFIIARQENGLSRLLWASFDKHLDKWIAECSYQGPNSIEKIWL